MGKDNPLFLGENLEELVQGKHILLDLKVQVPLCEWMKELQEGWTVYGPETGGQPGKEWVAVGQGDQGDGWVLSQEQRPYVRRTGQSQDGESVLGVAATDSIQKKTKVHQ